MADENSEEGHAESVTAEDQRPWVRLLAEAWERYQAERIKQIKAAGKAAKARGKRGRRSQGTPRGDGKKLRNPENVAG